MADVDAIVVGAGVIGLAIARKLAGLGLSTVIAEQGQVFGNESSSRNSEVIHAGLYYAATPLKGALCLGGRELLYRYLQERNLPHQRIGKLIVAFNEGELAHLRRIAKGAEECGVLDLRWLSPGATRALEPTLNCAGALLSPSTGILDSHAYMLALLADAQSEGTILALRTQVSRVTKARDGSWSVYVNGDATPALSATRVVNAAGHGARALALNMEGIPKADVPPVYMARGNYFIYQGKVPFRRLIYPVPVPGGLGTHLTLDLAGGARFGPDVEWINQLDYTVDPGRADQFLAAARRIWPSLDPDRLVPGYCGVRTKLSRADAPAADFAIHGQADHGALNVVNLYGIESPGLTASLAIADLVTEKLELAG